MDMMLFAISNETIGTIIDIVIVSIVVIYALAGIAKGFYESLLKFISTVGALAGAIFGAKYVLNFVNGVFNISGFFANLVLNTLTKQDPSTYNTIITDTNRETIVNSIKSSDLFSVLKNFIVNLVENAEIGSNVGQVVSTPIGYIISIIVVAIAIYLAIKLVVFILSKIFSNSEAERGGKSGLDRTLGLILGTAKGLLFVATICIILSLASYLPFISDTVTPMINETQITKRVYTFIDEFVTNFITSQDWNAIMNSIFNR